jgi:hypothetical protein
MAYAALAVAVLAVHFAYLGYVVLGGFLAWRWPRTVWVHLVAVGWGVALIAVGLDCPLTQAQNWARLRAGQPALTGGFVDQYVEGVLYPQRYTPVVQALVVIFVVGSWIGLMAVRRPPRPARTRSRSRTR